MLLVSFVYLESNHIKPPNTRVPFTGSPNTFNSKPRARTSLFKPYSLVATSVVYDGLRTSKALNVAAYFPISTFVPTSICLTLTGAINSFSFFVPAGAATPVFNPSM